METFWNDLRYGLRTLAGNPHFSLAAIMVLALALPPTGSSSVSLMPSSFARFLSTSRTNSSGFSPVSRQTAEKLSTDVPHSNAWDIHLRACR